MITASPATYQRAIDRARERGGAGAVTQTGPSRYSVLSSNGADFYTVTVHGDYWLCTCPAGQSDRCCWHLAAVWLHLLAESARGAEAPASAPVPAKWFLWDYPDEPGFDEWKAERERAYFGEQGR
jgi:hypothetical protein